MRRGNIPAALCISCEIAPRAASLPEMLGPEGSAFALTVAITGGTVDCRHDSLE